MPEEVVLLVENELATLIDDPLAHPEPTLDQLQRWNAQQEEAIRQQLATAQAKGTKQGHAISEEALQKRRLREEKRLAETSKVMETSNKEATLFAPEPAAALPSRNLSIASEVTKLSSIPHTIIVPAPSSSVEWYDADAVSYATVEAAKEAGIWDYPSNLQERAKCGVFRSLWEQGFFMGGGIKFGGDYLVYPGDPLRYHSHFAASIVESPMAPLRPMEIVAHGRLGTATKKAHLLCGWDDDKKETSYLSIEWAGFG
ncbi:tRNA intron endonuclease [Collybia nuda]|uniref:tRNA-splicing endonuclease subunit Sen34 n=1 Tax=Collybia nuda TaxID=64659 RepID=A0A9P5YCV1_9AGAR|nr:tRNA intron endonuclease [Collybia nuda]